VLRLKALPRASYAYLTRKSVYGASLKRFGQREIDMGFYTVQPTLRNMFLRFSLPVHRLADVARRAGFGHLDEPIPDPHRNSKLDKLISDPEFLEVLRDVQRVSSADLAEYLGALGYWECESVALVDVGWNGTTQEALDIAFEEHANAPNLHGFYLALLGNKVVRDSDRSKFRGMFFDYRNAEDGSLFYRFVELFEMATRAPHPTVIGFRRMFDGSVEPEFRDPISDERLAELSDEAFVATLQAGIFDYCDDYVRTLEAHDTGPEALSDYILYKFDRLIRYPTRSEAQLLSSFSHVEGFGQSLVHADAAKPPSTETASPSAPPTPRRILWLEGIYGKSSFPGLNHLFNLYRFVRHRRY